MEEEECTVTLDMMIWQGMASRRMAKILGIDNFNKEIECLDLYDLFLLNPPSLNLMNAKKRFLYLYLRAVSRCAACLCVVRQAGVRGGGGGGSVLVREKGKQWVGIK